tara:strand:+ start:743 stop:1831 length:1089 start_codon:yes stop_codon:yes gene_type:complete
MGSTMLEQAIVDASALREAALKSAEQVVINRFSPDIKEAVDSLLEVEDLEMDMAADLGAEDPMADPMAAAGGEWTSGGPDAPEDADDAFGDHPGGIDEQIPLAALEELMEDVDEDTILEIELDNLDNDDPSLTIGTGPDHITPAGSTNDGDGGTATLEEEDDVELEEADVQNLAESLDFDYEQVPNGSPNKMKTTNACHDTEMVAEIAAAIEEYDDEEKEKLKKENKQLKSQLKKYTDGNSKLVEAVNQVKLKFKEVQLMNAKLLYTNKILVDDSLNERQKKEIVESIKKVSSLEQAKMVYETLQSTAGSKSETRKGPKSLSEAAQHKSMSSLLLRASKRSDEKQHDDPAKARWKELAGIKT